MVGRHEASASVILREAEWLVVVIPRRDCVTADSRNCLTQRRRDELRDTENGGTTVF
jgi:hypothetical protein